MHEGILEGPEIQAEESQEAPLSRESVAHLSRLEDNALGSVANESSLRGKLAQGMRVVTGALAVSAALSFAPQEAHAEWMNIQAGNEAQLKVPDKPEKAERMKIYQQKLNEKYGGKVQLGDAYNRQRTPAEQFWVYYEGKPIGHLMHDNNKGVESLNNGTDKYDEKSILYDIDEGLRANHINFK